MPLDTKTLKNGRFFKVFEIKLFGSLKLLMALLGSSCPLSGRSGPKMDPKMIPKTAQKRYLRLSTFFLFDFFQKYNSIKIRRITVQFCNTIWTNLFAQNPKKIYKRNQDETKRAIMSFKESNNGL